MSDAQEKIRKPRADSVRNREQLLNAGKSAFNEAGVDVALEEVARRAGVGIGTLYRHFPTRASLLAAVYRRELDQLAETADQLLREHQPAEAMERWFEVLIGYMATKRVVGPALRADGGEGAQIFASGGSSIRQSLYRLARAAVDSGEFRSDLQDEDLERLLIGFAHGYDQPGWEAGARRMLSIMMAGLRA